MHIATIGEDHSALRLSTQTCDLQPRMPSLPIEIHGRISDFVESPHDLFHYLQTCRSAFGEIERRLYRRIHLKTYDSRISDGFIQGLLHSHQRCFLIREFVLSPDDCIPNLVSTLSVMANLTYLHIRVSDLGSARDLLSLKDSFKLKRFTWLDSPFIYFDIQPLTDFLVSQPSITQLYIPIYTPIRPMPLTTLPNLKIVHGPALLVRETLPGRDVERLRWTSQQFPDYFISTHPYVALRVLKLNTYSKSFELPTMCPNLRYLETVLS